VGCTDDSCDETQNNCVNSPNDGNCADNKFCNGNETCSKTNDCQPGNPPCPAGTTCNEGSNTCEDICTDVVIRIGDNDGYGYGPGVVPDNSDLPIADKKDQYCFGSNSCSQYNSRPTCVEAPGCGWVDWQFDNQNSESGGNGAQYTDKVFYGPGFTFTISFTPMANIGQAQFSMDVSGIQSSSWGASSIHLDGVNYSSMLPADQGTFGSNVVYSALLNQADVSDGALSVSFQGGTVNGGDAIAFDYFELSITCEP
jgi:hypothetical protein